MNRIPTMRQSEALEFVRSFIGKNEFPPTIRETMTRLGLRSTNAAARLLRALEQKGLIEVDMMKSRAIRLTELATKRAATPCGAFTFFPILSCSCCNHDAVHNGVCARCGFALRGAA